MYIGLCNFYEDNKIISCSVINKGYNFFDKESINYTFKAIYERKEFDFPEILLINNETSTEIIEMFVDGKNVTPSFSYSFNDTGNHEIIMLLDVSNNLKFII